MQKPEERQESNEKPMRCRHGKAERGEERERSKEKSFLIDNLGIQCCILSIARLTSFQQSSVALTLPLPPLALNESKYMILLRRGKSLAFLLTHFWMKLIGLIERLNNQLPDVVSGEYNTFCLQYNCSLTNIIR
jgi:hypothetical protein